jgi:hypothetical protein
MSAGKVVAFTSILVGIGGGIAAIFATRRTTDALKNAVAGKDKEGVPVSPPGAGVTVPVRVTGYWPFTARPDEVKMEGGVNDRKGNPLHTLEDFQAGKAPFVSVSGDYTIFPYGQRISLAEWPGVVFRIVDTGSHFHGANKVYRIAGREPFDVCVASSATKVVPQTDATIYAGDHFEKGTKDVALARIGKPSVAVGSGLDYLGVEAVA